MAEDPGIGGGGAADHDGIAAGFRDEGAGVFGGADVSIADDGDVDGSFDFGDVFPAGLAGVALFAGAGVDSDGVEAGVLGEFGEGNADDVVVVPAEAVLDGEGNCNCGAHRFEDGGDEGQVAEEAAASIAGDDAFGGAAEVEVDHVEAGLLDDAGGVGEGGGVGAEELGGDGVLVVVEGEVALALGFAHAGEAVGGSELGHDEAAAGLLVGYLIVDGGGVIRSG